MKKSGNFETVFVRFLDVLRCSRRFLGRLNVFGKFCPFSVNFFLSMSVTFVNMCGA